MATHSIIDKAEDLFFDLPEYIAANMNQNSGTVKLELEISGSKYRGMDFGKIRFWKSLCKALSDILPSNNTSITFSFRNLEDLNELRELCQATEVLPRLVNVRFAASFFGEIAYSSDAIFRGLEDGFEWCDYTDHPLLYSDAQRMIFKVRSIFAQYGRKLVEKSSNDAQAQFPFLKLPAELQCMVLHHMVVSKQMIPLHGGMRWYCHNIVDFANCCGSCGGEGDFSIRALCFCRGDHFTFSTSCTCPFPSESGLFATSVAIRKESLRIFFLENRFSVQGDCFGVLHDLNNAKENYLCQLQKLHVDIDGLPGYSSACKGAEKELDLVSDIVNLVSERCRQDIDVCFCFPVWNIYSQHDRAQQLSALREVCLLLQNSRLSKPSVYIDDIFDPGCPKLQRWSHGKVRRAKMFGTGVEYDLGNYFSHLDKKYTG
jgi:hypothetical protein